MKDPTKQCVVCGGTDFELMYPVKDTNQGVPGTWDILACNACHTGVLSPFPNNAEIGSYYQDHFYTQDGKRFRGWMEGMRGFFGMLRGRILNQLKPERGRLMDFGSGAGHFAAAQAKVGWEVYSVDPYSSASSNADACRLTEDSFELLYPDGYFDAVTLWYVIEHLRNPRAALAEIYRVLKPGAVLVLGQQDFDSVQARFFGANWLFLDPPRHLWQFTARSLTKMAQEESFICKKVSWAALEMSPFCMLQSALNMIVGNRNDLFRFLKNRNLPKSLKVDSAPAEREIEGNQSGNTHVLSTLISLLLLPILIPIIMIFYFSLLPFRQGDVFTLYLVKR